MVLQEGSLLFNFEGALKAFKFDEPDPTIPTFHGLSHCMKAVDFVVEYKDYYLFVEVKNPTDPGRYAMDCDKNELIKNLVTKFRDTFVYRWATKKLDKPISYQCFVEVDNAQTLYLMNQLKRQLPTEKLPSHWQQPLVRYCAVLNMATWNRTFSDVQVTKIAEGTA